jgi:hypothetical protein
MTPLIPDESSAAAIDEPLRSLSTGAVYAAVSLAASARL